MGKEKRSTDEIRRTIEEFQNSGLRRREFCRRHHIPVTTLDYWRRVQSRQARLVEVEVVGGLEVLVAGCLAVAVQEVDGNG